MEDRPIRLTDGSQQSVPRVLRSLQAVGQIIRQAISIADEPAGFILVGVLLWFKGIDFASLPYLLRKDIPVHTPSG